MIIERCGENEEVGVRSESQGYIMYFRGFDAHPRIPSPLVDQESPSSPTLPNDFRHRRKSLICNYLRRKNLAGNPSRARIVRFQAGKRLQTVCNRRFCKSFAVIGGKVRTGKPGSPLFSPHSPTFPLLSSNVPQPARVSDKLGSSDQL